MENARFQEWWQLHIRAARGEPLSGTERQRYQEGLDELDTEEVITGDLVELREARERVASLEAENARLRERRDRLDEEIRVLEAALGHQTRQLLGIED